jgi:hypothetical protein
MNVVRQRATNSYRVTNSIALELMTTILHAAPTCKKHGCEKKWYKNKCLKAGGQWECPTCRKERFTKWRQANRETHKAHGRAWARANPENSRAWKQANPEKIAAWGRAWREANPEKHAAKEQRRRARKRNATVPGQPVTAAAIAERFALFDGCAYCGADKPLEIEHFIALSDGGLHIPSNLLGCCRSCNSRKNDNPVEEWFRSQPFFSVERWERLNEVTCA